MRFLLADAHNAGVDPVGAGAAPARTCAPRATCCPARSGSTVNELLPVRPGARGQRRQPQRSRYDFLTQIIARLPADHRPAGRHAAATTPPTISSAGPLPGARRHDHAHHRRGRRHPAAADDSAAALLSTAVWVSVLQLAVGAIRCIAVTCGPSVDGARRVGLPAAAMRSSRARCATASTSWTPPCAAAAQRGAAARWIAQRQPHADRHRPAGPSTARRCTASSTSCSSDLTRAARRHRRTWFIDRDQR